MTLKEASVTALSILKQVMEEKLNSTNVEVSYRINTTVVHLCRCFRCSIIAKPVSYPYFAHASNEYDTSV